MKVYTHNFNPRSNSGPNKFTRTMFNSLISRGQITPVDMQQDADVEFCLIQQQSHKVKPMVLRLDGIYFNSDQDYDSQNAPIKFAYENADAVIFQSFFNKKLTEHWFGEHKNSHIIHNAADLALVQVANASYWNRKFGKETEVWSCASSWRPHKRLDENIKYFIEHAPEKAVFAIAGALHMDKAKEVLKVDNRIFLMGDLDYMSLLSLYKRSSTFVHLAYLDHCPNVVVDAQASGCKIICSSTGGTKEIIRSGRIINEKSWNFTPTKLYSPPEMDFENSTEIFSHQCEDKKDDIVKCSEKYFNIFKEIS